MVSRVSKSAGLAALVAACALLSAGCIVQDRPHEGGFFVVADAGENHVVAVGESAHLEWAEDHAVKAEEGEAPHVEVDYEWTVGDHEESTNHTLTVARSAPSFVLIELNVTAENTTASDAVGVLVVPDAADSSRRLYVATVGEARFIVPSGGQLNTFTMHHSGEHVGYASNATLPAGSALIPVRAHLPPAEFPPEPVHASLVFAVKDGPGAAREVSTGPLEFEAENAYTLWVDPTTAGHHKMEVRDAEGALLSNGSLEEFEAAHPAEEAVEVLVSEAQTLPGFEAAATVAGTVAVGAALVAARRRP